MWKTDDANLHFNTGLVFYALNYTIHKAYINWSSRPDLKKKTWLYFELMICDKYRGKNTGPKCVKMDLQYIVCVYVDLKWIHLAWDKVQSPATVNLVFNIKLTQKAWNNFSKSVFHALNWLTFHYVNLVCTDRQTDKQSLFNIHN
jgi:hypothetical protein